MNTSFSQVFHAKSQAEPAVFREQTRAYSSFLRLGIMQLKKSAAQLSRDALTSLYKQAHVKYRLRYQALEAVAAKAESGDLTVASWLQLADILLRILTLLCIEVPSEATRDELRKLHRKLDRKSLSLAEQILVVYDYPWLTMNAHDRLYWARKLRGPDPLLTCDWDEITKPQSAPASNPPGSSALWLTKGQRDCGEYLKRCFRLRTQKQTVLGYRVRPPLVVAPSGAGKSTLAKWLSGELNVPLFQVDSGSWMLAGSRADKGTLLQLSEFIDANSSGIIFVDEADKFAGTDHSWWVAVNQELFQLIDGRLPWPAEKLAKFQNAFFMMAAGTWQSAFRQAGKQVGFQSAASSDGVSAAIETNLGIPEEVLFRFEQPVIMSLPTSDEFAERINRIRSELNLPPLPDDQLQIAAGDAVAGRRGNRWLENYVSALLHEIEQEQRVYPAEVFGDDPYPLFEF